VSHETKHSNNLYYDINQIYVAKNVASKSITHQRRTNAPVK